MKHDKELKDPRGRTPLHLAVCLGHLESAKVLLRYGANANAENKGCWSGMYNMLNLQNKGCCSGTLYVKYVESSKQRLLLRYEKNAESSQKTVPKAQDW